MTIYRYNNRYMCNMEFEYKEFIYWIASNYPETTGSSRVTRGLILGDKL